MSPAAYDDEHGSAEGGPANGRFYVALPRHLRDHTWLPASTSNSTSHRPQSAIAEGVQRGSQGHIGLRSGGGRAAAVRWAGTAWTAASASRSPMVLSSVGAQSRAAAPPGSSCGYCGLQAPGRQLVYVAYTPVLGACVRQQTLPLAGEEGPQHGQQASPEQHKPKAGLQVQVQCLKRIALLSHVIIAANAARALGAKKKLGALCWAAGNLFARAPHRLLSFGGE